MKRIKLIRVAAITVLGLSLGAGVASAAPGDATIENTGFDSYNRVDFDWDRDVDVDNDTDVDLRNNNPQHASSGDASQRHNTTGGDAGTGDTSNTSTFRVNAAINNSGSSAAALGGNDNGGWTGGIDTTGADSRNVIDFNSDVDVDVDNDTDIDVTNNNHQSSRSGDARVTGNTTGGNATTGNASNTSTTEITIEVTN